MLPRSRPILRVSQHALGTTPTISVQVRDAGVKSGSGELGSGGATMTVKDTSESNAALRLAVIGNG